MTTTTNRAVGVVTLALLFSSTVFLGGSAALVPFAFGAASMACMDTIFVRRQSD